MSAPYQFTCVFCPATFEWPSDLYTRADARFFGQYAGWRVHLDETTGAEDFWCPACRRQRDPQPVPLFTKAGTRRTVRRI